MKKYSTLQNDCEISKIKNKSTTTVWIIKNLKRNTNYKEFNLLSSKQWIQFGSSQYNLAHYKLLIETEPVKNELRNKILIYWW